MLRLPHERPLLYCSRAPDRGGLLFPMYPVWLNSWCAVSSNSLQAADNVALAAPEQALCTRAFPCLVACIGAPGHQPSCQLQMPPSVCPPVVNADTLLFWGYVHFYSFAPHTHTHTHTHTRMHTHTQTHTHTSHTRMHTHMFISRTQAMGTCAWMLLLVWMAVGFPPPQIVPHPQQHLLLWAAGSRPQPWLGTQALP